MNTVVGSNKPSCSGCGLCCKLFLINLSEEEYRSGLFDTIFDDFGLIDDFTLASGCGANVLAQKHDGSCVYLVHGKCSIHERKPSVCRNFFCRGIESEFAQMRHEIEIARKILE